MSVTPIFPGAVKHGLTMLDRPLDYGKWVRSLEGKRIELIVRKRGAQRSLRENSWLWMANTMLAEHCGYEPNEVEVVHYEMLAKRFGAIKTPKGLLTLPARTSSQLTKAEFAEYMEWYVRTAAQEFGVVIPLPGEADYPDEAA